MGVCYPQPLKRAERPFFYLASGRSRQNIQNILQQICLGSCLWIISVMRKTSKCHSFLIVYINYSDILLSTTGCPSLQPDTLKHTKNPGGY